MTDDPADLPEQVQVRRDKRRRLLDEQRDPYPVSVPRTRSLAEVRAAHDGLPPGEETDDEVAVAGRVVFVRNTGRLCFATLQEGAGRLQVMLSLAEVGESALEDWKRDVDLGDFVWARGRVVSSRRGELSVLVAGWGIASKALRPLPVLHRELTEETRVRQRYVDLVVRPEARQVLLARSAVVRRLRESLAARGFVEVETPMLQTLHGGATARPFVTHSNALDLDLYLRIAPELFLKRCVVGGIDRVFEINRNFRNEGVDATHSPEFTMLEFYEAWSDYDGVADLTRDLIQEAAAEIFGGTTVTLLDGTEYDLGGTWTVLTMYGSLSESLGEEVTPQTPVSVLRSLADRTGLGLDSSSLGHGKLVEELWEHRVGASLWAPTFVRDFPVETAPLTREHRSVDGTAEKWDLYVRGFELSTGYSELVDPVKQRARFEDQARLAALGDEAAMRLDEDFLRAMEYGMPPTGGVGLGIDRLMRAVLGVPTVRETVLFPLVKPL